MKIIYNPMRHISTADLYDSCDPPVFFQVRTKTGADWSTRQLEWEEAGANDIDEALKLFSEVFMSVTQGGESWSIKNVEDAKAVRDALEDSAPGFGDELICSWVVGFARNHWGWISRNQKKSLRLRELSDNGATEKAEAVQS